MFRILYAFRTCYSFSLFPSISKQEMNFCPPLFPSPQPLFLFFFLFSFPPSPFHTLYVVCFFFCCRYLLSFIILTSISHFAFSFNYISCHLILSYLFHHICFMIPQLILSCLVLSYFFSSLFFFSFPLSFSFSI